MRILHIISTLDPRAGGPPAALVGLATAQQKVGLQVRVLSTHTADVDLSLAEQLRDVGVKVDVVGPVRTALGLHPELGAAVKDAVAASDVVHIHALWEQIQHEAAVIARKLRKPYLITPHGMLTRWALRQSRWRKRLFLALRVKKDIDHATAVHFATSMEAEQSRDLVPNGGLVETLGVDLSEFDTLPQPGEFIAKYPRLAGCPLIMFMGRIHPGKGVELLIPAFAALKHPDAVLVVVGPDSEDYLARMQQLAEQHGVKDRVVFTGMLRGRDRIAALVDATLFALPSHHENFGMVVIEALAAGTPVILSDHVAVHPQIAAARVGAAVPLEVDAARNELARWLGDDQLREDAARLARPFVSQHFAWNGIAQRWIEHYQHLTPSMPTSRTAAPSG